MIYGHIGSELCREFYSRKLLKAIEYCKNADTALMTPIILTGGIVHAYGVSGICLHVRPFDRSIFLQKH